MSYNLLADKFLPSRVKHLSSYDNCYDADFRAESFLTEFKESGADVICLQEVSTRSIGKKLETGLAKLGY
jgi:mRNA deadenylase 3'-5' endonuclease subunit Ccr4